MAFLLLPWGWKENSKEGRKQLLLDSSPFSRRSDGTRVMIQRKDGKEAAT